MAKLTFILEDGQEVEVSLTESITIGRSEGNSVVVDDERIFPRHAEVLTSHDGRIQVREVDAGAELFVNTERVQSYPLRHGDQLAFGPLKAIFDSEEVAQPPTTAKPNPAEENSQKEAILAREKHLAELQSDIAKAEKQQAALIAAVAALVKDESEKTAALRLLDQGKDITEKAASALKAEQEKRTTDLKQLTSEVTLVEQRITSLKDQSATLEAKCHNLEKQTSAHQSQLEILSKELQAQQARQSQLQTEIQAAETELAQNQAKGSEIQERNTELTAMLADLDEEHSTLTELIAQLKDEQSTQQAKLTEETLRVTALQEQRTQLESECRSLSEKKQRLAESVTIEPVAIETPSIESLQPATEPPSAPAITINRIVPRVVSAETITPRPRGGIPMKSERISRKEAPRPKEANS